MRNKQTKTQKFLFRELATLSRDRYTSSFKYVNCQRQYQFVNVFGVYNLLEACCFGENETQTAYPKERRVLLHL